MRVAACALALPWLRSGSWKRASMRALAAIRRRSRPAAYRQANDIVAILPASTMRFEHVPRGIRKG
jgi:hypothetical protein